ncbi:hypothetical protein [Pararhodobacter zhoushanensis]|uniref:Uncharacterized protein n=1 Tax=Pararhodobacter zhoushanensis TaxID=2479545 RepID=A0ABT3H2L4_9RHOB|nr:hypothetical protein [Pararhodobacter zhoushanensis]MCW1404418.1 hypothetical protein [Novosphingobium sp. MW5]MCW1934006.1 hypothetical protein [Pararhodobacter zhoushanensis]
MFPRPTRALFALCAALCAASPALAQTPARFPAIPEAQIEAALNNAYCGNTITTISRTVGQIEGWRGYAMLLCDPQNEPAGVFVAWMQTNGRREFVPTSADGVPFRMPSSPTVNDGNQQSQATYFVTRLRNNVAICYFARANSRTAPFTASFCWYVDAQGNVIDRR